MERNFSNKDFEQFVKRNADQYRMYPSEKVWKGVYSSLHTRRKWYGLGFVLLVLTAVIVTWVMVSGPSAKQQAVNSTSANSTKQSIASVIKKEQKSFLGSTVTPNNILPEPFVAESEQSLKQPIIAYQLSNSDQELQEKILPGSLADNTTPLVTLHVQPVADVSENEIASTNKPFQVNIIDQATDDNYNPFESTADKKIENNKPNIFGFTNAFPMTIESVLNSYKKASIKKHVGLQFFITPTVSYRRLSENKSFLRNAPSSSNGSLTYAYLYNVNSVVTHKPDMGFQIGLTADYPLANVIKLLGGLQFNVNRYGIKAYNSNTQVATIQLNSGGYRPDSVATITNYSNFNGYSSNWLQNFYFSVSAPIGAEVRLAKANKSELGIAATVQPTYVLGDKAYLISTDYKNYVQVPWLVRRWNVNTSLQAYVNFNAGKMKMQVGPQVRYQLLSSFQNKYPVKENLFDFGLKLGIKLNK